MVLTVLSLVYLTLSVYAGQDIPRFFVDEDFYVYSGGIPQGWSHLTGDDFTQAQIDAMTVNDSSMEILEADDHNFQYVFDETMMSGIYDIEFDISNTGGWYLGLIPNAALMGDGYVAESAYVEGMSESDAALANYNLKKKCIIVGGNGTKILLCNGARNYVTGTALAAYSGKQHVKIRLDLDANKIYGCVDDGNEASVRIPDSSALAQRTVVKNIKTGVKDMIHGIGGMSFGVTDGGSVRLSNLVISKANSYNAYQDFNTITAGVKNAWYSMVTNGTSGSLASYMSVTEGRYYQTDSSDKAISFNFPANANIACFMLDKPIKAGEQFVIEYDILTEEDPSENYKGNAWNLAVLNTIDTQVRKVNTYMDKDTQTGEKGIQSNYAYTYTTNDILYAGAKSQTKTEDGADIPAWNQHVKADGTVWFCPYHEFQTGGKVAKDVRFIPGEWNHITAEVIPSSTSYDMVVTVTHEDGSSETATQTLNYLNYSGSDQKFKFTETDICGLKFGVNSSWMRGSFTLDNLKVYTVGNDSVANMTAKIDKELYPRENAQIKIHFSEPLSDTEAMNKANVSIVREADGSKVENFEIEKVSDKNYKISVDETLLSGRYNILFGSSIKGKYSKTNATNKVSFKTEYERTDAGIVYPEVNSVKVYDFDDKEIDIDSANGVTSKISKIEVTFNTLVDNESARKLTVLTEDGKALDCEYEFEQIVDQYNDDVTVLILKNLGVLPSSVYELTVSEGIISEYDESVVMKLEDKKEFTTIKEDTGCFIGKNFYDETSEKYIFKLYKNDKSEGKLSLAVSKSKTVGHGTKEYEQIVDLKFIPINLSSSFRGEIDEEIPISLNSDEKITTYLWSYPNMYKISIGDGGEIEF